MLAELNSALKKDWFDLRSSLGENEKTLALLGILARDYQALADFVKPFSENGLFEAKQTLFNRIFKDVEAMGFRALSRQEMQDLLDNASRLVAITVLQREALLGNLDSYHGDGDREDNEEDSEKSLTDIVKEINMISHNNPGLLKNDTNIQNILKLVRVYTVEQHKMKDFLKHTEAGPKRDNMLANFKGQFEDITRNIRRYYANFQAELRQKSAPQQEKTIFELIDKDEIQKACNRQMKGFTEIRAAINYTRSMSTGLTEVSKILLRNKKEYASELNGELHALERMIKQHFSDPERLKNTIRECENEFKYRILAFLEHRKPDEVAEEGQGQG